MHILHDLTLSWEYTGMKCIFHSRCAPVLKWGTCQSYVFALGEGKYI